MLNDFHTLPSVFKCFLSHPKNSHLSITL